MDPSESVPLTRLELLELSIPRLEVFRSAIGDRPRERALLVRWWGEGGSWGIGEVSCRADPYFNGEFVDGAWLVLRDHLAPLLSARGTVADLEAACARVRGWPFTAAALLDAAVDLLRRGGGRDWVDGWGGARSTRVPIGISLGLFPSTAAALASVGEAVARGYRRLKLKIAPGAGWRIPRAVREAFPDIPLVLDANGTFGPEDLPALAELQDLDLAYLEQPFPPGHLELDRQLRLRAPRLPLCLDESLTHLGALKVAVHMGAIDVASIKPGRVGGPFEAARMVSWCADRGLPTWVGGMFETGVGRSANLRVASCTGGGLAHDLRPPLGYLEADIVAPPLSLAEDGTIDVGRGEPVTVDWDAVRRLCVRRAELMPGGR